MSIVQELKQRKRNYINVTSYESTDTFTGHYRQSCDVNNHYPTKTANNASYIFSLNF